MRRRPGRALALEILALLAATVGLGGCGDDGTSPLTGAVLALASGDGQRGLSALELPEALTVSLTGAGGEPLGGVAITWLVTTGFAGLSAESSSTGADGLASVTLTPSLAGVVEVTAELPEVGTVTFGALAYDERDDPGGDTFEGEKSDGLIAPDLIDMRAWPEAGYLVVELEFAGPIVPNVTGDPNAVIGFVDIDADQDSGTGIFAFTDLFNPGGSLTGMGTDYFVDLRVGPDGTMFVGNRYFEEVGSILPGFAENVLVLPIPLTMLADEGQADLAAVVGTVAEPTDVAPDVGTLSMGNGVSPETAPPAPVPARTRSGRIGWSVRW